MDPTKREKYQANRKYYKTQFLQILFQYCLTAYVLGLFLSKAFPFLCSPLKHFIFFSLPSIGAFVVDPKCLFILCNMIVIFLVRESMLVGSPSSSPTPGIYDEYVKHSRSVRRSSTIQEKEERKLEVSLVEENVELIGEVVEEDTNDKEEQEQGGEEEEYGGVEEHELPTDELNRRSEDFIERVRKQMKLEAQMMECGGRWETGVWKKNPMKGRIE